MIQSRQLIFMIILFFAGLMIPFALSASPTFVNANQPDLPEVAKGVPMGGALHVFDLDLDQFGVVDLELERFTVFAPDAEIVIEGAASVPPPKNSYFHGHAKGLPNAVVVLTVPEQGKMRGLITDEAGVWRLAGKSGQGAPGLANRKIGKQELNSLPPFECGTESLLQDIAGLTGGAPAEAPIDTAALPGNVTHTARVAVETDYEYYAKFDNTTDALNYMGDLFAYASTVYEQEVNTNLVIGWSRLWPSGAASDPWAATSGTSAALSEFLGYWNSNMGSVDRTIAHMLSGKSLGGGIAYVGVLCNTSYGYGVSASLGGNFNIDSPSVVWDILVVSHEIGHNFRSSHTQDYCDIDGVSDPVDLCYNSGSSCGNAIGLPGIGSLSGGITEEKPGTIMSYCHLVSGGYSNISFTFGMDHPYGVAADRVPMVMYDHVLNRAENNPSCLELIDPTPGNIAPTAGFNFSTTDLTAIFADTSSDSDGTVDSWSWDFGDSGTSTTQDPSHTYAAPGSYTVSLTVTDNDGASSPPATQTVSVTAPNVAPTADFTFSTTALTANFTDASSDSDGNVVAWSWSFGDGNNSTVQSPSHTYAAAGTYTVSLTVTDDDGATSPLSSKPVTVTAPPNVAPTANFTLSTTDLTANFTDTSSDSDGNVVVWSWDFGDNTSSADQNPIHTYASAGTYTVSLTVTDNDGAISPLSNQSVTVTEPPVYVDQVATGETLVAGTVSGSYLATRTNDGTSQSITERDSGGKPANRYSHLEHIWHFNVSPGNLVTLYANAWSSGSSDGDDFMFAYSLDGSNYTDMLPMVSNTSSTNMESRQLPNDTDGPVWIRVRDTDRTSGNRAQDTVYVDHLYIRSENAGGDPPTAPTGLSASASSSSQIDLAWSDNADDESGFKVERSENGGSNWTQLTSVGAGVTSYSDTDLSTLTTYRYRVAAYNGSGTSAYSNEAEATTLPGASITLSATVNKVRGSYNVGLSWSGAAGDNVDIYHDGSLLTTTGNDGSYSDPVGKKPSPSYDYMVCEKGDTPSCSDTVTVNF